MKVLIRPPYIILGPAETFRLCRTFGAQQAVKFGGKNAIFGYINDNGTDGQTECDAI